MLTMMGGEIQHNHLKNIILHAQITYFFFNITKNKNFLSYKNILPDRKGKVNTDNLVLAK